MAKNLIVFFLCFAVAFGGGYLFYHEKDGSGAEAKVTTPATAKAEVKEDQGGQTAQTVQTSSSKDGEIFTQRGCIQCHSISALGVKGGQVGPDLSKAYINVKDKHGIPIEQFLKKPTSAVMSGVLGSKPLTDDELKAVLAALKTASEK